MLDKKETQEKVEIWVLEYIERPQVIKAIRQLREEWEEAAAGESLLTVKCDVGYLLYDVCRMIGLTEAETIETLGFTIE